MWTWSHQDKERVFSVMDVQKGAYSLVEKSVPGGRVLAIAATEERMWIGTTVSIPVRMFHADDIKFRNILRTRVGSDRNLSNELCG